MKWNELHPNLKKSKEGFYIDADFWKNTGRNIFIIADEVCEMLRKTDFTMDNLSNIKVPYDFFFVASNQFQFNGFYITKNNSTNECLIMIVNSDYSMDGGFVLNNDGVRYGLAKYDTETVNLIIGSIMYVTLQTADIIKQFPIGTPKYLLERLDKAHTKRKKEVARQALSQAGYTQVNIVGSSFKSPSKNVSNNTVEPHWRRGHWRNQPVGIGLNDTKLIWIKPTIVNSERGLPQKGKIYK